MTSLEPLKARNAGGIVPLPAPAPRPLSELVEQATMLAKSPKSTTGDWSGDPGRALLGVELASRIDKPILWVMQNVAFIYGKPLIQASGVKDIAADNGYQIIATEGPNEQACTVELRDMNDGGRVVGTVRSTVAANSNPKNNLWQSTPMDMVYANAVRRVWKYHGQARGGAYLVSMDDVYDMDPPMIDPVEVLAPQEPEAVNLLGEPDPTGGFPAAASIDETGLKAAIAAAGYKPADVLKKWTGKTLGDIVADPALCEQVMSFLEGPA